MSGDVMLEPCPFCGGESLSHGYSWPPEIGTVQCHDCDALITGKSEAETIAAWNRRSSSAAERAVVEALHVIADQSANQDLSHRDFRIKAHEAALAALSSVRGEGGDKQATRREDAATAPISTDTKGTTK